MKRLNQSISVIMPALNEELNIEDSVNQSLAALEQVFDEYELILVNDGSTDRTGPIMDELASRNPRIRVLHNERNLGLGGAYKRGLAEARYAYVTYNASDNVVPVQSLQKYFSYVGQAEIIITYYTTTDYRSKFRNFLSSVFTTLCNALFRLRIRYYNGLVIFPTGRLRTVGIMTDSFSFQAEALIKMLKRGYTYKEVDVEVLSRPHGSSKALRIKNLMRVFTCILSLIYLVYFKRNVS